MLFRSSLARGQFTLGVVPNGWDGRSERQPGLLWLMDAKENSSQFRTNLAGLRKKWTESGRKMRTEKIRDVEFTVVIVDAQEIVKTLPQLTPGPKTQGAADEANAFGDEAAGVHAVGEAVEAVEVPVADGAAQAEAAQAPGG